MVSEFAINEVEPIAAEIDEEARFPIETIKKAGKIGLMGMPFPIEYKGAGSDYISYVMAIEELSKKCGSTGVIIQTHCALCAWPIMTYGTESQRQKYLPGLLSGETIGAFGLTEPNAGSDAGGTETSAVLADGKYTINGSKVYITNASYAKHLALTAVTGRTDGKKEISAIIVPTDSKGFKIIDNYEKMGLHASNTTELLLEDVVVPEENLLGESGKGFQQFLVTLDGGRIGIGAMAVGIAQAAYERALTYSKERKQFGKTLSSFQITQFKLADMAMKIELARTMVYKAAWLKDQGRKFTKEASMCKLYASEIAMEVANEAIQIHGGYGYMREYEVERYLRDAKLLEIGEGTSEVQRMVIARQLGC